MLCYLASLPNSGFRALRWQLKIGHGGHLQTLEIRVNASCKTFTSTPTRRATVYKYNDHTRPVPAHGLLCVLIEFQSGKEGLFA